MTKHSLDWKYFDWGEFQRLCIEIAEMIVTDCSFSEYLGPGQKQEGIDLISFKRKEGKFFTIQCKREKKLTESDFKKILSEFYNGEYFKISSYFIIATSANLQKSSLQKFINNAKIENYDKYGLEFDCWDVTVIEKYLKNRYDLVTKYFGDFQAEEFCIRQMRYERLQNISALPNYIQRKLIKFNGNISNKIPMNFSPVSTFNLIDLVTSDRTRACRICVVGDAYQGKSSYIKQTVFELQENHPKLQPILLQIKEYNVQPISELLSKIYGEWRKIPLRDIVLILDGLDEVPTEKFNEMVNHIKEFALTYCHISIIFSCRKLFYIKYNVANNLYDFETYDLFNLQYEDVDRYIVSVLNDLSNAFKTEASVIGISNLLFHPFYLVNIVKEYKRPPNLLSGSKMKVIDSLINRSFDISKYRKIKGSESIKDEVYQFNHVIEKFAFALQLAGVNSFSNDIIQQLFNTEERLLLQHNSLLTHSETSWGFINALFQEHIAARKLSKMSYDGILTHCTVGKSIKKIKTKWIQTISSLLSILDDKNYLFEQIFNLVESDNLELLKTN
jgi:Restriction endonuclease